MANVAPTPSIASIGTPRVEGTAIAVTGAATDPAGANDTLSYSLERYKNGATRPSPRHGHSFSFTPDDNGSYRIALTVTDEDGGSATVESTIDVANVAPSPSIPASARRGSRGRPSPSPARHRPGRGQRHAQLQPGTFTRTAHNARSPNGTNAS